MRPLGTGQRDRVNVAKSRHGKLCQPGASETHASHGRVTR